MTRTLNALNVLIPMKSHLSNRSSHSNPNVEDVIHALKSRAQIAAPALPSLRFEVSEAAQILRMSRAQLYNRIHDGSLRPQKDGGRTYITRAELERYVQACSA
jgi:excisionase family DNA binding protein